MTLKKKIAAIAISAAALVASFGVLAGCSGGDASITGVYTSSTFTFQSMYPNITFKFLTNSVQSIRLYDDNTYEFTVSSNSLSGGLSFDPTNSGDQTADATSRGQVVQIYMGSYTSAEEEGLLTVTLGTPTQYIYNSVGGVAGYNGYINTSDWTEKMATELGGENGSITAEEYLDTVAFSPVTVTIDLASYSFNYVTLSV